MKVPIFIGRECHNATMQKILNTAIIHEFLNYIYMKRQEKKFDSKLEADGVARSQKVSYEKWYLK
jgi:hypothetical protein